MMRLYTATSDAPPTLIACRRVRARGGGRGSASRSRRRIAAATTNIASTAANSTACMKHCDKCPPVSAQLADALPQKSCIVVVSPMSGPVPGGSVCGSNTSLGAAREAAPAADMAARCAPASEPDVCRAASAPAPW